MTLGILRLIQSKMLGSVYCIQVFENTVPGHQQIINIIQCAYCFLLSNLITCGAICRKREDCYYFKVDQKTCQLASLREDWCVSRTNHNGPPASGIFRDVKKGRNDGETSNRHQFYT